MVCAEIVGGGLVQHMAQVTIWTLVHFSVSHSVSLLGRIQKEAINLKHVSFSFFIYLALQSSMSSIHT